MLYYFLIQGVQRFFQSRKLRNNKTSNALEALRSLKAYYVAKLLRVPVLVVRVDTVHSSIN